MRRKGRDVIRARMMIVGCERLGTTIKKIDSLLCFYEEGYIMTMNKI